MKQPDVQTDTVIIGAGPAGLAVGACLKQLGASFIILEQAEQVGSAWRKHYDRLHLHTDRGNSGLPHLPMPGRYPKYPSRQQVVEYLEAYAAHFQLTPLFSQRVLQTQRADDHWAIQTQDSVYHSGNLVIASGYAREPNIPVWPDQDTFGGIICHSSQYKNGSPFQNQRVLVVGFGNSGGEIAIDLCEHGAETAISVRNPVNVIPRDIFGIPVLAVGLLLSRLPPRLADALSAPLIWLLIGDLRPYGLEKLPYGPNAQIRNDAQIPLLDIGTVKLIKQRQLKVFPAIKQFTPDGVIFNDGRAVSFDAVILATGYRPCVSTFLRDQTAVLDEQGTPVRSGEESPLAGLYFCGFYVSPTGMLREIGREAVKISEQISRRREYDD